MIFFGGNDINQMLKDLKYIKITIAFLLLGVIMYAHFKVEQRIEVITPPYAFSNKDTINFSIASNSHEDNYKVKVKNVLTSTVVYDTIMSVSPTFSSYDSSAINQGFPKNDYTLKTHLPSGLYTINDSPILVNEDKHTEVTFVVPFVNTHFYTPINNHWFFKSNSTILSLDKQIKIDEHTKGLLPFMREVSNKYSTKFVTDLDLEDKENFNTNLLIIYGKSVFWSPKMLQNLLEFTQQGGNVLLISENAYYAQFCYDSQKNFANTKCEELKPFQPDNIQTWRPKLDEEYLFIRELHSVFGGEAADKYNLYIKAPQHACFSGIQDSVLSINARYFMGVAKKEGNQPLENYKVLASVVCQNNNLAGVIEYNNKQTGTIVLSLGSEDFCLKESQENPQIHKIMLNSVDYLLQK